MVAAAIIGSTVVGGLISSDSSRSASNKAQDATDAANALQKYQFDTTRADNQPLMNTRNAALGHINGLLANPNSVMQDPGYQFGFDQGTRAIGSHAAANGSYFSGATLKDLTKFGQDYGSSKFTDILNRYNAAAGLGQAASSSNALAGVNYANGVGNNLLGNANVQGANSLNQGNIWANGINQLGAYGNRNGWFGGTPPQSANSFGGQNGAGWGSGVGYGNEDLGASLSDIRLKTNIKRIGLTPRGFNAYSWDWKDGSGSSMGVIAQEVQMVDASAVAANDDGLLAVYYAKV